MVNQEIRNIIEMLYETCWMYIVFQCTQKESWNYNDL